MNKTYQPFIIKMSNKIVDEIEVTTNFFTEKQIKNKDFTKTLICDFLTEKFVEGTISSDDEELVGIFTENELGYILHTITIQDAIDSLKEKGIINSFEQNGEEHYFLTEVGKHLK